MSKSIIDSLREIVDYCKEVEGKNPDKIVLGEREYAQLIEELKYVHMCEPRSVLNTEDIVLWGVKIERFNE